MLIAQSFWLATPVALTGIAHMVVVKANLLAPLARPIDAGRTLWGQPVFGANKTWRGVVFMVLCAAALGALQGALLAGWARERGLEAFQLAVNDGSWLGGVLGYALLNAVFGFGYALGELPNSFVKRRLAFAPGATETGLLGLFFLVVDQIDSVVVGLLLAAWWCGVPLKLVWVGTACLGGLHLAINLALYAGRIKKQL
jgi:hypothetical protein